MATTTAHLVAEFIQLSDDIKDLTLRTEALKARRAEIEADLLERFTKEGYQRLGARGHTVFVHRQLWARAADDPHATVKALKASDWNYLVEEKFNVQQLSAVVRELIKTTEKESGAPIALDDVPKLLPTQLQSHIAVSEKFSLRVRKG